MLTHADRYAIDHQGLALEGQYLVHGVFTVAEHLFELLWR